MVVLSTSEQPEQTARKPTFDISSRPSTGKKQLVKHSPARQCSSKTRYFA
nr:MAG TPA: hypothetical protein [Caudoviricetes sp.]